MSPSQNALPSNPTASSVSLVPLKLSNSADLIELKRNFTEHGFAKIGNICSREQVQLLKCKVRQLVDAFDLAQHPVCEFGTDEEFNQRRGESEYFLSSGDKIAYFLEKDVYDSKEGRLKVPKHQCLNKIGHALHSLIPEFIELTLGPMIQKIAKTIGLVDPVVVQSMVIFKNAHVGGEVKAHQDATFLHCLPKPEGTVVGFWIPLDDATLENGCLQFAAGTHIEHHIPPSRWCRVVEPETGNVRMEFTDSSESAIDYSECSFIPVPTDSGDCLLIDGLVVHRSEPNLSDNARWVYTFHVYDRSKGEWDPANWLQPTEQGTFTSLYSSSS